MTHVFCFAGTSLWPNEPDSPNVWAAQVVYGDEKLQLMTHVWLVFSLAATITFHFHFLPPEGIGHIHTPLIIQTCHLLALSCIWRLGMLNERSENPEHGRNQVGNYFGSLFDKGCESSATPYSAHLDSPEDHLIQLKGARR